MRARLTLFQPAGRRGYAATPVGDITGPQRGEAGVDGDSFFTDLLAGGPDVNPLLSGSAKFQVYDEMAKTDPAVKGLLLFIVLPAASADWGLNPATDEPEATVVRDLVAWNVGLEDEPGHLDLSWKKSLRQVGMAALRSGASIEELVWDDVVEWRDADGDPHLVRPLARLAQRNAKTIQSVKFDRGRIATVTQNLPNARPIPGEKVCHIVPEPEPGRWEGVSLLRPAWGAWYIKKQLQIAAGIGWDRFASGLPVVYHPDDPDAEARARRIGAGIRNHERSYVNFPATAAGVGSGGRPESEWWLELVNGAQTLADPTPLLRFFSAEIAEAGLQAFSKLGLTETGSRAVAEVQVQPFYLAVQGFAEDLARERTRQVIRRLVEVNFGAEAADRWTPKLTVSKIIGRNIEVVSRAIALLAPLGFQLTEAQDQNDVREMLGFGALPAEALAAQGVPVERLRQILAGAGLDPAQLAAIVNALPPEFGVARNTAPPVEGGGLAPTVRR